MRGPAAKGIQYKASGTIVRDLSERLPEDE
jgi:hypothetical protein